MSRKTWGPFTGSQLTVILTAALLSLAVPGGLWAAAKVQYSFVSLYDAKSKQAARLGAGGALEVTNGVGPLAVNGGVTVSDGNGPLTVDGSVTEAAPANVVSFFGFASGSCTKVVEAPATSGLIVKRVIVDTEIDASPAAGRDVGFYISASGCGGLIGIVTPSGIGTTTLDLGPGFMLPPGASLWSQIDGPVSASIFGTGYLVPASAFLARTAVTAQIGGRGSQLRTR